MGWSSAAYLIYGCRVDEFTPSDEFKDKYDEHVENEDIYSLNEYNKYGITIPVICNGMEDEERLIGIQMYAIKWSSLEIKDPFTTLRKAAKLWKKYSTTPGKIYLVSSHY